MFIWCIFSERPILCASCDNLIHYVKHFLKELKYELLNIQLINSASAASVPLTCIHQKKKKEREKAKAEYSGHVGEK